MCQIYFGTLHFEQSGGGASVETEHATVDFQRLYSVHDGEKLLIYPIPRE